MAVVQREFSQPMKYFLTEAAERVANGVRPFLEANLEAIKADPAHGLVLDAPAGAESKKVGCEAGDAALIRNYVFLKTFVAASIAPDMGIPNLGDFKDWSYQEGAKLRQLLANLQRVTRRTVHAKSRKTQILKKLFAIKMGWLSEEDSIAEDASEAENDEEEPEDMALEDGSAEERDEGENSGSDDIRPRNLEADLETSMHRLLSSQSLSRDGQPLDVPRPMEELLEDLEEFAGPEDVPHPSEILGEEELAELELEESVGRDDVKDPLELLLDAEMKQAELGAAPPDFAEGEQDDDIDGSAAEDEVPQPLVTCAAELPAELRELLEDAGTATRDERKDDQERVTPPAASDRRVPSSASDPKWKKPCPARVGKGKGAEDGESKKPAGMGRGGNPNKGSRKAKGKGKGRKGALPSSSDENGQARKGALPSSSDEKGQGREGALPSSSDVKGKGREGALPSSGDVKGKGRDGALPSSNDVSGNGSPAADVESAKGRGREGALPSDVNAAGNGSPVADVQNEVANGMGNGSPDAAQNAKGRGREGALPNDGAPDDAVQNGKGRGREGALPNDGAPDDAAVQNGKGRGRGRALPNDAGNGRGQNAKGRGRQALLDEAAIRRQQLSDQNLQRIRDLAPKHPELQPQVSVDKKHGSTVSWTKHRGISRAWLLATFLAGWYGDVDPIEESDDDNDDDDASWLYGVHAADFVAQRLTYDRDRYSDQDMETTGAKDLASSAAYPQGFGDKVSSMQPSAMNLHRLLAEDAPASLKGSELNVQKELASALQAGKLPRPSTPRAVQAKAKSTLVAASMNATPISHDPASAPASGQVAFVARKHHVGRMDTRSTVPLDSQGSPAPPDLVLADMLELSKDRLGAAIFLDALQLSPGATAFKEWLLSDFIEGPEHILDVSDAERFETLARVYEITKQLVTEAQAKAQSNVQFVTVGHDRVMRSAEQAVAKVTKQAAGKHDEASKQRVRVAEAWLQKEMASLENKKQEHASAATRCATFAAAKIHCFINHLREANLLSSSFVALMETWHELDACHTTASKLKQVDKQLWDTQVEADTLKDNEDMDAFGFADEEADPAPEQTPGSPEPLASQIFVDGDGAQEELILAVHPAADGHQHGHGADLEHQQCPGQQQSADQGADLGHQQSAPETLGHPATAQGADLGHQQSAPEMAGHPNGEGADLGHPQLAPEEADLGHTQSAPEAGHPNGQGADLGHPQSAFQEADLGHTQSVTEATGHPDGQGADLGHRQSAPEEADLGHPQSAPEAAGHPDGQQADLGHQQSACEEADLGRPQSAPEAAGHPDGQQADLGQQQSAPEARHQQSVSQEADLGHQQQQLAPEIGESQQCEQAVNDMVAEQAVGTYIHDSSVLLYS
ncbi:F5 [Symbiodinium sp. KB8]|nr:F5 [Symbiodinium sp. KB8]